MIERLSLESWIAFDRQYPAPTFFARPAWAQALAHSSPSLTPMPLLVRVDDRSFVVPTMGGTTRGLRFSEAIAFPLGGYTCILDERGTPASREDASRAVNAVCAKIDHVRLIPWPLAPVEPPAGADVRMHETAVIDCTDGFDAVLSRIRGVTRRMAGQAERRGVSCARAPLEALPAYYDILREASVGWGLPRPPVTHELLAAVLHFGAGDAELWFAELEGERIAGGVVLYGSSELFFWSAAMRREFGKYRPSNALNLSLLRATCERGVRWYNLGASEGLEGVARFKSDLGAEAIDYPEIESRRRIFSLYERAKSSLRARERSAS